MNKQTRHLVLFTLLTLVFFSCKKSTEDYPTAQLSEYQPLATGKYITYRLDSTVFKSFGTVPEVHSYQEKHVVDSLLPDALGRPSYRVFRFIRDTSGTGPWQPAGSYFITSTRNTIEVIENNLRVIKLTAPIQENNTWKGNRYLPDEPMSQYTFSNDLDMNTWDYTYGTIDDTIHLKNVVLDSVITVNGIDRAFNAPVTNQNGIGYKDYIQDRYAKHIGLVYQEFIMWEYQPPHENVPVGQTTGFGIRRSMIDHN